VERTEEVTYLDTHVVVWLFGGENRRLSAAALEQIRQDEVVISPAVILELQLLHEIRRTKTTALKVVERLSKELGLAVCALPFESIVENALDQSWTRDPFDRLIVANALANDAPLITKDEEIRRHYRKSVW
jgi:PIN domain nuclease of toxin-antitoxin system